MSARLILTAAALRDASNVVEQLAKEAGRRVALKYRRRFDDLFGLLADHPGIGPLRPRLGRNVRFGVVSPYLVFYRHEGDVVTVLRIIHGRRKITAVTFRKGA